MKIIASLLAIVLLFNSCTNESSNNTGELQGTITISGAFALYPLVVKWGEEFQKLHPGVKVDVSAGGAGKGIADALHNHVNLGMVSREVRQEEIKQGAWGITVARDAVLPTVNADNPYIKEILAKGITKDKLYKIWVSDQIKTWGEVLNTNASERINKYKRSDASGAGETWASYFNQRQDNLLGTGVFGDPGLAHAVIRDKFAVGFNNIAYVYDLKTQKTIQGLQVLPIDFDSNGVIDSTENFYSSRQLLIDAIASKKYPSPPGRDLYFVSHGAPKDRLLVEFFKFVLTEGQKFVPEMGYLKLSQEYVKAEVEILEGNVSEKE